MPDYLASEVAFEEENASVIIVTPAPATDAAVCFVTERGPFGPYRCDSFDEFLRVYGGHVSYSTAALWMKTCFEESGGGVVWISRVVHHTDPNDPDSKTSASAELVLNTPANVAGPAVILGAIGGPYAVVDGDKLDLSVNGSPITMTIDANPAKSTNTPSGPYVLANGQTLTVAISGAAPQTITFATSEFANIAAATAAEVAAALNARLVGAKSYTEGGKVVIESDVAGSGQSVAVSGGTAAVALGFTPTVNGSGNVANAKNVTASELVTALNTALGADGTASVVGGKVQLATTATGNTATLQVLGTSTLADELGYNFAQHIGIASGAAATLQVVAKSDGAFGNDIRIKVLAPASGDGTAFNLQVEFRGKVVESNWVNLSMDPSSPRYVQLLLNDPNTGSDYVKVVDQEANLPIISRLPALGTFGPMAGGEDGIAGLTDQDFLGGSSTSGRTGMRVFDIVPSASLYAIPDRRTPLVHAGALTYVDVAKEQMCFFVVDLPWGLSAQGAVDYVKVTASIQRLSGFGATYWPEHSVANPARAVYGEQDLTFVPLSAHIIGATQRNGKRSETAIWQAAAGEDYGKLFTAKKPGNDEVLEKTKRKLVFPELINPVHSEEGSVVFIDGSRTLDDGDPFPTVGERLGVNFLKRTLEKALRPTRHKNIQPRLYEEAKNKVDSFMIGQTNGEAFASNKPSEAYRFDIGPGLNTASTKKKRRVLSKLSVATAAPAEFVTMIVSPDSRALEAELAASLGA